MTFNSIILILVDRILIVIIIVTGEGAILKSNILMILKLRDKETIFTFQQL